MNHDPQYTNSTPGTHGTPAEVLERWTAEVEAVRACRGTPDAPVVFALTLINAERLAAPMPGTESTPTRWHADIKGTSWLRWLTDHGFRFAWSPEAIRMARVQDEAWLATVRGS